MKILIVCSGNKHNFSFAKHQAFIHDQVKAVLSLDQNIKYDFYFIKRKGILGYLYSGLKLLKLVKTKDYDLIHAHFTLSALLANFQRYVPVISTFHGSDINKINLRILSILVVLLSKRTIYVSLNLQKLAFFNISSKCSVLPCGIDFNLFKPYSKTFARRYFNLDFNKKYILFSSSFDNRVKNFALAKSALDLINDPLITILELKNYSREEVSLLFSAVDVALLTSHTEGSPQFVKEALACNCPVVTTDVGDVRTLFHSLFGCFITSFKPNDVSEQIKYVLDSNLVINSRDTLSNFDNTIIAKQLIDIYKRV